MLTRQDWETAFARLEAELKQAPPSSAATLDALEALRLKYLGRKGSLNELLKSLKDIGLEERRALGPRGQTLKDGLETAIARRKLELEDMADEATAAQGLDLTLPASPAQRGRLHPLTSTLAEVSRVLSAMGFAQAEGPLVETDYNNFEALNIPAHHPARDMQDTFYVADSPLLMRTHTSPVQIRAMQAAKPPLRLFCPGRVFRRDEVDATHSAVFHQVEGLAVDKGLTFADLKGTLEAFFKALFGAEARTKFQPSYFPFTEPSAEVAVSCWSCKGEGCPLCKRSGWIELLGAGMVHPNVLKAVGYDPAQWSGFAFGMGVERLAMLRHGIGDIRLFYQNDLRFLRQFDDA